MNPEVHKEMLKSIHTLARVALDLNPPKNRYEVVLKSLGFMEPEFNMEGNGDQGAWANRFFDSVEVELLPDGGYELVSNFMIVKRTVDTNPTPLDLMNDIARGIDNIMYILADSECGIPEEFCKPTEYEKEGDEDEKQV